MRPSRELISSLESFEKEMHPDGPFFFGKDLSWVDILIAPCKYDCRLQVATGVPYLRR